MSKETRPRHETDPRWQWHLHDMFENADSFEAAFKQAKGDMALLEGYAGQVGKDPLAAITAAFSLSLKVEWLYAYAAMKRDEDGSDSAAQAICARTQGLAAAAESAGAFLRPELLETDENLLRGLLDDPRYLPYSAYLRNVLRDKPHTLPSGQEKLLAMAGETLSAPQNIFGMLDNVDLPFPEVHDETGEAVKLSHARYNVLIRSRDRSVRKEAFEGMMGAFKAFSATIAAAYSASVKGDIFLAKARGFGSSLEKALHPDEIPAAVYDNLLGAVEASLPALDRYMGIRKRMLRVDTLHMYDLYVPVVEGYEIQLAYPEAFNLVREGLSPLGPEYAGLLDRAYADGWIDVYENKSKRSGAYSWGAYGGHPYVLLNHTDDLNGAMTLAHELGHAMHSYYSDRALPYSKAQYSLFVAEVASTCNEMLLMRYLMRKHTDKKAQAYLANHLLEEFRTTVFRQTMFAAFERESHRMGEADEALTAEILSAAYYRLNEKYYGRMCQTDEAIASEWMRIPHFYNAFYVYKYATGFSAAVFLANRILTEGAPAAADYFKFLKSGGSIPPLEALKLAGVDMSRPEPIQEALKVFEDTVMTLEELLK
jgi:oligoendopeptidase F